MADESASITVVMLKLKTLNNEREKPSLLQQYSKDIKLSWNVMPYEGLN